MNNSPIGLESDSSGFLPDTTVSIVSQAAHSPAHSSVAIASSHGDQEILSPLNGHHHVQMNGSSPEKKGVPNLVVHHGAPPYTFATKKAAPPDTIHNPFTAGQEQILRGYIDQHKGDIRLRTDEILQWMRKRLWQEFCSWKDEKTSLPLYAALDDRAKTEVFQREWDANVANQEHVARSQYPERQDHQILALQAIAEKTIGILYDWSVLKESKVATGATLAIANMPPNAEDEESRQSLLEAISRWKMERESKHKNRKYPLFAPNILTNKKDEEASDEDSRALFQALDRRYFKIVLREEPPDIEYEFTVDQKYSTPMYWPVAQLPDFGPKSPSAPPVTSGSGETYIV